MCQLLYSVAVVLAVASVGRTQNPPVNCIDTGEGCINQCFGTITGEFQWCGSCRYYVQCNTGASTWVQCPGETVWNDNGKICAPTSPTCTECVTPAPLCQSTGAGCLTDCLGYPDGVNQYCGRCDYFLQCSSGTTFYTPCQDLNLEFDNNIKACVSVSTTCSDAPCADVLPPGTCTPNPCYNGGTCQEQGSGYICICPPGYTGLTCLSRVDPCLSNPCLNGGSCYADAGTGFVCGCPPGYTGPRCQTAIDGCEPNNPCLNGGTCIPEINDWTCSCVPPWIGEICGDLIDPCRSQPCVSGGTCYNNCGVPVCLCPPGYTGPWCNILIDNCASEPCLYGGTCQNGVDIYTCLCTGSFTGNICESPVDRCGSAPCLNGGTCVSDCGIYQCICPEDWTGARCETGENICDPNPCLNGGTCVDNGNDVFSCICPDPWTGTICESPNYYHNLVCGDLFETNYPPKNGFTRFCYYTADPSDIPGRNRECYYALTGLPLYEDAARLLAATGNFGCIVSLTYPNDNDQTSAISCQDNYQHSTSLGAFNSSAWLMICIRYPYEGIPLDATSKKIV